MISNINFFQGQQGAALQELVETLTNNGFLTLLAGGSVRDILLGRPYKDLDIATDASVEQIQKLFAKTIPVGAQFGIVRVIIHDFEFEVARFRRDGPYIDGRHPESIQFTTPQEDAERRDFTINALFYDFNTQQVLDYVQGKKDLHNRLIKTVGNPHERFSEDYLRVLRAIRFSCQLNFAIEPETEKAAQATAPFLLHVSGERLCTEITKSLSANPEKTLRILNKWGVPSVLFPQWKEEPVEMKGPFLSSYTEAGWLLSQLLFSFQKSSCSKALEWISTENWKYNNHYLSLINDLSDRFKLSKVESRRLKWISSVYAWPDLWTRLRLGFRGELSQSEDFTLLYEAALQLKAWDAAMIQEVSEWRSQPLLKCALKGEDVILFPLHQRGLVLKECLYLQYEKTLITREDAQQWLKAKLQKGN